MSKRATSRRRQVAAIPAPTALSPFRWRAGDWWAAGLLLLAVLLVYAPVLRAGFLKWDDALNITHNPAFTPPTAGKIARFWVEPYLDLYLPVTYTAWGILAAIGWRSEPGADGELISPLPFHLANLLVHAGSTLVVFALLRRLCRRPLPAGLGAALFALHPLQVEAVAWVTGMKDALSGLFALLSIGQYVAAAQEEHSPPRRRVRYGISLLALALAVLSKPSAVAAPLLAIILDRWILRRDWRRVAAASGPLLILAAAAGLFVALFVQRVSQPADGGMYWLRPLIAADSLAFYLGKLVAPVRLGFHYDHSPAAIIQRGALYWTWIFPAALFALALSLRKRWPTLLPALLIFAAGALPTLGLTPFAFQRLSTVADRYLYLSMLGPALLLAMRLAAWEGRSSEPPSPQLRHPAIYLTTLMLAALAVASFAQTFTWQDNAQFFANGLKVNPRSFAALNGQAGLLATQKKLDEAEALARKAIASAPEQPDGYIMLGSILGEQGKIDGARDAFAKAVDAAPDNANALDGLASALARKGQLADAEQLLRRAIGVDAENASAHEHLAQLLFQTRRYPQAFDEATLAVQYDPTDATAHMLLARLCNGRHDQAGAIQHLSAVLKIHPDDAQARRLYEELTSY